MAKKLDNNVIEIQKSIESKKVVIGTERTIKLIKTGAASKVFLSSNCPEEILADVDYYQKISPFEVVKLKIPNVELGAVCRKPFAISVLTIIK